MQEARYSACTKALPNALEHVSSIRAPMSTVAHPLPRSSARRAPALLLRGLWILFLFWSVVVAIVWMTGVGESEILRWAERTYRLPPRETSMGAPAAVALPLLPRVLLHLLSLLDPVWVGLAAVHAYLLTSFQEGLPVARRWCGVILLSVGLVAGVSVWQGWPLGEIRYTELLGRRLGPVPLGVPLLWLSVMLGARDLVLRLRPSIGQVPLAVFTGALVLLFDLALEPIAWKVRVFWLWSPLRLPAPEWPPVQNYLTWFALAAILAFVLREERVVRAPQPAWRSPAAVFAVIVAVVLLAHIGQLTSGG